MRYYEVEPTSEILEKLLQLSAQWTAEQSYYGYCPSTETDIVEKQIFLVEDEDGIEAHLPGKIETVKNMKSIMAKGTVYFKVEELYVAPEKCSQGVDGALLRLAEETIKKDMQFIVLSTASENSKAISHFYLDESGIQFWSARLFKKVGQALKLLPCEDKAGPVQAFPKISMMSGNKEAHFTGVYENFFVVYILSNDRQKHPTCLYRALLAQYSAGQIKKMTYQDNNQKYEILSRCFCRGKRECEKELHLRI